MPFDDYIQAQQRNLEQIRRLPHFTHLIDPLALLYELAVSAMPSNSPDPFARLLLACHKEFLSAVALMARGQPSDSFAPTRRAIEIGCLARGVNYDREKFRRWASPDERLERWAARQERTKPKYLKSRVIDPANHPIVEWLRAQAGMLSDAGVQFTPELLGGRDWRITEGETAVRMWLGHFEPSQDVIERDLLGLVAIHIRLLSLFDECFNGAFREGEEWISMASELERRATELAKSLAPENQKRDSS